MEVDGRVQPQDVPGPCHPGFQRGLSAQARVARAVVFALQPGPPPLVQVVDALDVRRVQGRFKLKADGPEEPLYLPASLGNAGAGMDQGNPETVENALGLVGDEGRAVVGVEPPDAAVGL